MLEFKNKYKSKGVETLPTQANKAPLQGIKWTENVPEESFKGAFGIGLKCGKVSNGLECLDFDNPFGTAEEIAQDFLSDDVINSMLGTKVFVASTTSGGYHLVFFSDFYEGNQKLARHKKLDEIKTVIETRGEGGYFCAEPTNGYKWSKHNLLEAKEIIKLTKSERDYLIESAKSFNKVITETSNNPTTSGEKIGDRYNDDPQSKEEALSLLLSNGWTQSGKRLSRPGKQIKDGISATFGYVAENVFYVFTSNAYPFEENKAYKPFQIKALLSHSGDFKACAKDLAQRYGETTFKTPEIKSEEKKPTDYKKFIIDLSKEIKPPTSVLSILEPQNPYSSEISIFHSGDFSVLMGKQKSKKTFFTSMILSAMATEFPYQQKLLSKRPFGKNRTAYFDTEQGDWYAQKTAKRISYNNSNFDYLTLRDCDAYERREVIEKYLCENNIFFAAIDGVVDLLYDFNNLEESAKLVQWLMTITKKYDVHILNIIHQNKSDGYARGHLGSMLSQKAETVIEIEKLEKYTETSVIKPKDTRGREFEAFGITINEKGIPNLDVLPEGLSFNGF